MTHYTQTTEQHHSTSRAVSWLGLVVGLILFASACGVTAGEQVSAGREADGDGAVTTTTESPAEEPTDTTDGGEDDPGSETEDTTGSTQDSTTTTTEGSGFEVQPGDQMMRDALIQGFTMMGLTQEQAECLADGYMEAGITDPNANVDVTQLMDVFTQCGVSMEDLGNLGAGA
ncbi:MAG: hypothetical protein IPG97_18390 [Microthrixaceae bacterium]|nr:hypothetical protein [Microthrixaceae bacterium]